GLPCPFGIRSAQIRIVFDKHDRQRNEDIGTSPDYGLYSHRRLSVTQENQCHHWVAQSLNPSLKGNKREVRPKNAESTVKIENGQPDVVPKQFPPRDSLPPEHKRSRRH